MIWAFAMFALYNLPPSNNFGGGGGGGGVAEVGGVCFYKITNENDFMRQVEYI